jgi:hypothetical protein
MKNSQGGFVIPLLITIIVLLILGVVAYSYFNKPIPEVDIKLTPTVTEKHLDIQGLEWTDDIPGVNGYMEWSNAKSYCEELSTQGGLKPNKKWRLPTKNELISLYEEAKTDLSIKSLNSLGYWTSEKRTDEFIIVVNGNLKSTAEGYFFAKNGNQSARCVR